MKLASPYAPFKYEASIPVVFVVFAAWLLLSLALLPIAWLPIALVAFAAGPAAGCLTDDAILFTQTHTITRWKRTASPGCYRQVVVPRLVRTENAPGARIEPGPLSVPADFFTPFCTCPTCQEEALHWMSDGYSRGAPLFAVEIPGRPQHWTHTRFDVVRDCYHCGHQWGQNVGIANLLKERA